MNRENVETAHTEGPPWSTVGRFSTFEKANEKRNELLDEGSFQVKVHWQGTATNRFFAVKTRIDPTIALEETLSLKREEKKRRKARLNRKRRKK